MTRGVTMGLLFYPRGRSAQHARQLARALVGVGWQAHLVAGSVGQPGERTHAESFYAGLAPVVADYNTAIEAAARGRDPLAERVPLHPSFEDRPGASDRVFGAVSPKLRAHIEKAWRPLLRSASTRSPSSELVHLHHLTPLHGAATARASGVHRLPVVTQLHGSELDMLAHLEHLEALANELGLDIERIAELQRSGSLPDPGGIEDDDRELLASTAWGHWVHGAHSRERMVGWTAGSRRLVVTASGDRERAIRLVDADPDRIDWIPAGVDIETFRRLPATREMRLARWRRWMVEDPQGWTEARDPGALAYAEDDLDRFVDPTTGDASPVLMYVGRFTEPKRVPLLLRAYARARPRLGVRAPLVIWGGFPGEWEGEHPYSVVRRERIPDVFFAGWRGHSDLPQALACADVLLMPAVDERVGQVCVEAMACGVPAIAARSGALPAVIDASSAEPTGWLVEPDSVEALSEAIVAAVVDPDERRRRSRNAERRTRAELSWEGVARRTAALYERALVEG